MPIAYWQLPVSSYNGPLTRYVKLLVAHAPGIPGTFSPPPTSKETASQRSRHASRHVRHARAVMHVGITNPRWRGKRSRHSRRMRNPQFYVSGKRPMGQWLEVDTIEVLSKTKRSRSINSSRLTSFYTTWGIKCSFLHSCVTGLNVFMHFESGTFMYISGTGCEAK